MIRSFLPAAALASALALAPFSAALGEETSPLELRIRDSDERPIEGVQVSVRADSGEPFEARGATDRKGRFRTSLPASARAFVVRAEKPGLDPVEERIDLDAAGIDPGRLAEVGLTMTPPTPASIYERARAQLTAGDLDRALALMAESVALDAGFFEGWKALSGLYLAASRPGDALAAADAALALEAADAAVLRNRYEALSALGGGEQLETALDALVAHTAASGDTAVLVFNHGVAAMQRDDAGVARRRFLQALELAPELHQAHAALAELAIGEAAALEGDARSARLAEALRSLDAAIETAPPNLDARERKAQVLRALGRADEAEAVAEETERLRAAG